MELSFEKHGAKCTPSEPCLICRIKTLVEKRYPAINQAPFANFKTAVGRVIFSIEEHEPGCKPCNPCINCKAWTLLKTHTGITNEEQLLRLLGLQPPPPPRPLPPPPPPPVKTGDEGKNAAVRAIRLDTLELSARIVNQLGYDNIITIGDVLKHSSAELLRIPNFGRKSLAELKELLDTKGLHIGMDAVKK
jgi:hypothetical protein